MNRIVAIIVLFAAGSQVMAGEGWFLEAGGWYRGGMNMEISGGSIEADDSIGQASGGDRVDAPTGQMLDDDGSAQTFRAFDNGYVGPSGWAWARDDGTTQYWGYDDASQYDAGSSTLRFTRTETDAGSEDREVSRIAAGSRTWQDSIDANGFGGQVTLGRIFHKDNKIEWSGVLQAGWLQDIGWTARHRSEDRLTLEYLTYRSSYERQETWTYEYDTLSNPAFPSAPYASNPTGTGPMIRDRPSSIQQNGEQTVTYDDRVVSSRQVMVQSDVSVDADALLFVVNLGTRFRWNPSSRWALVLQPGITANLLDAEMLRHETFTQSDGQVVQTDSAQMDEQVWLAGVSMDCGVQLQLSETLYVLTSAGYDYVQQHTCNVGPDRITMDLSGYSADIALGIRFF